MIDERELREMLERRAGTISATPTDAPKAVRRARRRLALNAAVGGLVGLVLLAGAFAGVRAIQAVPAPADPPPPTPMPARLGSLAYAVNGDIYVANWDGSHAVRIADGSPPSDCGTGGISGTGEYFVAAGPIWSPDGRYLAYRYADCDGPRDAWWDVVISDPQGNIVTSFPSEGWGIPWSPDSTRVAVWDRWDEGTIGVYGLDGVRQTLLTPDVRWGEADPVWSPDGESLLLGTLEIPLDGSPPRQLPGPDRPSAWETLSPDGSRIAYTTGKSLVVSAADGSDPEEVFGDWAGSIAWSPTGDRIAFTSGKPKGGSARPWGTELRLLDVATGTVTLLTVTEGSDTLSAMAGAVFEFSPEGDRILFSTTGDWSTSGSSALESSVWSINTDGSDLRRLVTGTAWADWLSPTPTP
jgi:Tol biopolymer transport system component